MDDILLSEAPHTVMLELTRVRTREPDRLEYLGALHLKPGAQFEILHAAPFNGPIQSKLGRGVPHHRAQPRRDDPGEGNKQHEG